MGQRERKIKTASPTRTVSNEFYSRVKALLDKKVNVESRERERERDSSSIVSRWQKEKEKKIATRLSSFSSLSTSRYLAVVLSRVRLIDPALPSLQQLGRPRSSSNGEEERSKRGSARSPRRRRRRRRDVGAVRRRVGRGAPGRRSARCASPVPRLFSAFALIPTRIRVAPRRPPRRPKSRRANLSGRDDDRRPPRHAVIHPLIVPRSAGAPNTSHSREKETYSSLWPLLSTLFPSPSTILRLLNGTRREVRCTGSEIRCA